MRISAHGFSGRSVYLALVASLGLACNDNPASPSNPQLAVPTGISASVSDPGLNYNDTWVSSTEVVADTTTINSNDPFTDPMTDQQTTTLTVGAEPQSVEVLAGYGYDGQLRVTNSYPTANASETQVVQQVGDGTGDVDQSGNASSEPLDIEPIANLGTLQDAQIDPSSGGGGNMSCDNRIQDNGDPSCQMAMTRTLPGQIGPSLVRQDATHLQVVQSFAGPSAMNSIQTSGTARSSASAQGVSNQLKHATKLTRDYEKHGNRWILKHVLNEETIDGPKGKLSRRQHMNFIRLESFQNPVLDAARAVRRAALDTESVVQTGPGSLIRPELSSPVLQVPGGKFMVPCDENCGGGSGGGGGGGGGSTPLPDPPANDETVLNGGDVSATTGFSGPTIVLQHGFHSDQKTFERMHNWILSDMTVASVIRHSLLWKNLYEDQASQLQVAMRTSGTDYVAPNVILVAHSNGGMISRYLGRHNNVATERTGTYYAPIPVQGVVTIGTTHWGVPAVKYGGSLNALLGVGGGVAVILCWFEQGGGCQQVLHITTSGVHGLFAALQGPIPVLTEMWPRDSYHDSFNAQPESFQRYGIQSYAWKRWGLWRIYGDSYCYNNTTCGGPAFVKKADRTYHHDVSCSIVGFFTMRWGRAAGCAADGAFLILFDNIYRRFTEPNPIDDDNYGDGIVPGWSQRYPNIPGQDQYPVHDGPSHVGETKDPRIGAKVEVILASHFGVPRTNPRLGY